MNGMIISWIQYNDKYALAYVTQMEGSLLHVFIEIAQKKTMAYVNQMKRFSAISFHIVQNLANAAVTFRSKYTSWPWADLLIMTVYQVNYVFIIYSYRIYILHNILSLQHDIC